MLPLTDFRDFITQNNLFHPGEKVLLAASGGKDSALMCHLFNEAKFSFGIAHCNFQLRGNESDEDESFVETLSKQFQVPYHLTRFDTLSFAAENHISVQMAARELRYQWFEEIRRAFEYDYIAVAHHSNDVAETILLNLVRGTGISGLHGILPKREKIIRPLLFLKREKIDEIIISNNIPFREDSSNLSAKYARNKIRLEVIPKLKEINPKLENTFEANSKRFAQLEDFLNLHIGELRKKLFRQSGNDIQIDLKEIKRLQQPELFLFELFRPFGFRENVLNDMIQTWDGQSGKIFESGSHQILLDRDQLILSKRTIHQYPETLIFEHDIKASWNSKSISVGSRQASEIADFKDKSQAHLDSALLQYPLKVRSWKEADIFFPFGMKGHKKISDYFIGQKIPLHEKREIPLLINGNGDIIWVAGYRIDERYKITPLTEKVTIFELENEHGK